MRRLFFAAAILSAAVQTAVADTANLSDPNELLKTRADFVVKDSNDPNELLMNTWDAVTNIIAAKDIDWEVKEKVVEKIVTPLFDFPLMAKLTLGRKHWPKLTTEQAEKFTQLFTVRLKDSYRKKIMLYKNEKATLLPAKRDSSTIQIPMKLVSDEQTIDILYKFRNSEKNWKIYDVEIQGVSILLTYRSQFDDILQSGSVEELLDKLRNPEPEGSENH